MKALHSWQPGLVIYAALEEEPAPSRSDFMNEKNGTAPHLPLEMKPLKNRTRGERGLLDAWYSWKKLRHKAVQEASLVWAVSNERGGESHFVNEWKNEWHKAIMHCSHLS